MSSPARTTKGQVQAVLGRVWGGTDVSPYIEAASALVDQVLFYGAQMSKVLSSVQAEIVERWLAACFYQQMDPGYTSHSQGGQSGSFRQGSGSNAISGNNFGLTAIALDWTRVLAAIDKGNVCGVQWAGCSCWCKQFLCGTSPTGCLP